MPSISGLATNAALSAVENQKTKKIKSTYMLKMN